MATYTLDVLKWRSGGQDMPQDPLFNPNAVGDGCTAMLNEEGFMCCLGQFSQKRTEEKHRYEVCTPDGVATEANKVYDPNFVKACGSGGFVNTDLSEDLMAINDDALITPKERVKQIRDRLAQDGHKLRIINAVFLW